MRWTWTIACVLAAPLSARGQDDGLDDDLFTLEEEDVAPTEEDRDAAEETDEDLFRLDTIVATGTRGEERLAETPVATEVIDREQIQGSGAETLAEILEEQPGIDVFDDVRGQSLRLQGLDPQHVLILVDGERTVGRINGAIDLSRYSLDEIERIEIVRGASSALYGSDALGGVINLITRRSDDGWMLQGRATYGYQDRRRSNARDRFEGGPRNDDDVELPRDAYGGTYDATVSAGRRTDDWDLRLSAGYHRLDGFDLDPRSGGTNGASAEQYTASGRGSLRLSERTSLQARLAYSLRDTSAIDQRGRVLFDRLTRTEDLQAMLATETVLPNDTGKLRVSLSYGRFDDQYLVRLQQNPPPTPATITAEQIGSASLRWSYPINVRNQLTVGYDSFLESLESGRLARTGSRGRLAPYLQHKWTPSQSPYFVVLMGLRVDADSWFGNAVSPKLTLRLDPTEKLVIRASGGRGFRAPGFRELLLNFSDNESIGYVVVGNPDLQPETAWTLNGNVEWRAHHRVWLAAIAHWSRIDDLITTDVSGEEQSGATRYTYVNIESARTQGVELQVRLRPFDGFQADVSYTFLDTEDLDTGRPLPGRARHRASVRFAYRHAGTGLRFLWRSQLVGARRFTETDMDGEPAPIETDPFLSLDLRVEKKLGDHLRLFIGADNVMNNGGIYLGIRPRTFYSGMAAQL